MQRTAPSERRYKGVTYDSKAEMRRAEYLEELRAAGHVRLWLRQPVFDLGGVVYRPDFLVVWRDFYALHADGCYEEEFVEWYREHGSSLPAIEEVKPKRMQHDVWTRFVRNRKQVLEAYGVLVALVRS